MIKQLLMFCLVLTLPQVALAQDGEKIKKQDSAKVAEEPVDDASTVTKASYLMGYQFINRFKNANADFEIEQILAGINAAVAGEELKFSLEERRSVMDAYNKKVREKATAARQQRASANTNAGTIAMAEFAKNEGAKEIASGVMVMEMKAGDGEIPELPDRVEVNLKGMYADDGTVFSSTEKTGKPMVNSVTRFVPGLSSAIQKMKVGSKWKVFVRGDQAYGLRPINRDMGPNRAVIYEIELLQIMPIE